MSRIKAASVVAAATVVLLAVGATTALASFELSSQKCEGGVDIALCYGTAEDQATGLLELVGTEEFIILPSGSNITFKSAVGEEEVFIECTSTEARHGAEVPDGVILQSSPLTTSAVIDTILHFSGCKLTKSAGLAKKCKVPTEESTVELVGTPKSASEVTFKPKAGTSFIEIPFENNGAETCPATVKGNKAVKGEQLVTIGNSGQDLTEHSLDTVVKSGLKFGASENPAEFKADLLIEPLVTEFWSVNGAT